MGALVRGPCFPASRPAREMNEQALRGREPVASNKSIDTDVLSASFAGLLYAGYFRS
jgi:hypothetical protein